MRRLDMYTESGVALLVIVIAVLCIIGWFLW